MDKTIYRICSTCRKHFPVFPLLIHDITRFVTRLTWRVPLVEQELPTLPEHLRSSPVFIGILVTVDPCLSLCTFSFGHCVFCTSSKGYGRRFQSDIVRRKLFVYVVFSYEKIKKDAECVRLDYIKGGWSLSFFVMHIYFLYLLFYTSWQIEHLYACLQYNTNTKYCNMSPTLDVFRCQTVRNLAAICWTQGD